MKFFAIVKHEYKKIVLKWSFLIGTLLLPTLAVGFMVVPAIIFSLQGDAMRVVVADPTGKILPRLETNLSSERLVEKAKKAASETMTNLDASQEEKLRSNSAQMMQQFVLMKADQPERDPQTIRSEMIAKMSSGEIDAYLLIPANFDSPSAVYEFRSRKGGDFVSNSTFQDALNDAVRSQRLADANISEEKLTELSSKVNFDAKGIDDSGAEKDTTGLMIASFIIGLMIYLTLTIYGQAILAAVIEEKETRIAEILFSSARPFDLMMGKLVGVGLAGLSQLAIWVGTASIFIGFIALQADLQQVTGLIPTITPLMILYFLIYFLLGFFIYASMFALIGSVVTSMQEGGQFSFPPILLLLVGFYFSFAVIRDPNSSLSFWVSIAPFFAPITMPVRILAEMPPFWQIALSIVVNAVAITGLVWLAARVYRVGMLMYGKRATVPEIWKWIRQA